LAFGENIRGSSKPRAPGPWFAGGILFAVALALPGCSVRSVNIISQGVVNADHDPQLAPGVSIAVVTNPEGTAHELQSSIAAKMCAMLAKKSFRIASPDDAQFLLLFDFGTDLLEGQAAHAATGLSLNDLAPVFSETSTTTRATTKGFSTPRTTCNDKGNCTTTVTRAPKTESKRISVPTTHQSSEAWLHYFIVSVIDGSSFREGRIDVVWKGTAWLNSAAKNPKGPLTQIERMSEAALTWVGQSHEWSTSKSDD
jgi:hypothetical protein